MNEIGIPCSLGRADDQFKCIKVRIDIIQHDRSGRRIFPHARCFRKIQCLIFFLCQIIVQKHHAVDSRIHKCRKHLFFTLEMFVKTGCTHSGSRSDPSHRCVHKTVCTKLFVCRFHDQIVMCFLIANHLSSFPDIQNIFSEQCLLTVVRVHRSLNLVNMFFSSFRKSLTDLDEPDKIVVSIH